MSFQGNTLKVDDPKHTLPLREKRTVIETLKIERFKSIRELNLSFGRVNIFIGGNGSGKSNLLEAIGVMSAALSRGISDSDFGRKGVRITPPALMKSAFKGLELPKSLRLRATLGSNVEYYCALTSSTQDSSLGFQHESCTVNERKIFGRSPNGASACGQTLSRSVDKYRGIWDQTKALLDYPDEVSRELDQLGSFAIYAPQTEFLRGTKVGKMETPPIGLHGEGLPTAVRTYLNGISALRRRKDGLTDPTYILMKRAIDLAFEPGWAERVQVGRISDILKSRDILDAGEDMVYFVDKFMHSKRNTLSVYDSSEGTLFLLFAAILLSHSDSPKVFAMDNVDSALNPKLTRRLLETIIFASKAREEYGLKIGPEQVFLTSHNPTSLDAFDIFDNETRIFVVSRKANGETDATRLSVPKDVNRDDWRIASRGRNLSQIWIEGEIKGALGGSI
jgi:hypothetical protein